MGSRFAQIRVTLACVGAAILLTPSAPAESSLSWESETDASYIGRASLRGGEGHGSADDFEVGTRNVASFQLREGLLGRLGFDLHRSSFGISGSARIPNTLQKTSLVVGADLQLGEAWLFRLEVEPGFYSNGWHFDSRDFNAPIVLGGSYFVSADLQFVAGISLNFDREYPVLPGVGFRWKISKDWVANFILPAPRLEYSLSKSLMLYVGADLRSETYRVHGQLGSSHGNRRLNNAVADYTQIRVGGGVFWKLNTNFTLELEGGFVPFHEFDFYRADERIRFTEYPGYGSVSLKAAF